MFERSAGVWGSGVELSASDGFSGASFGWSVAISGDIALVGARYDDDGTNRGTGSVYVFRRTAGTWSTTEIPPKLTSSDFNDAPANSVGSNFGHTIGISGGNIVVGAPYEDDLVTLNTGVIYFFE